MVGTKNAVLKPLVTIRLVRSKLRKRTDSQNQHQNAYVQPTAAPQDITISCPLQYQYPGQFLSYGGQHPMYPGSQDASVFPMPSSTPAVCRGFRKNLRGRWRRLVKRKPHPDAFAIPVECREQLKQMYVY